MVAKVIKPITNLALQTPHQKHFYSKFFGKQKLAESSYLSEKAKAELVKETNSCMREENEKVDFNRLDGSKQSEEEWEQQRKEDLVHRKSTKKKHIGNIRKYKWDNPLLVQRLAQLNGNYKDVNWTDLARQVELKNNSGDSAAIGGQVSQI